MPAKPQPVRLDAADLADKLLAASCRAAHSRRFRWHVAQRKKLYRRAVAANDFQTALLVLQDLAKLQGLYPAARLIVQVGRSDGALASPAAAGDTSRSTGSALPVGDSPASAVGVGDGCQRSRAAESDTSPGSAGDGMRAGIR